MTNRDQCAILSLVGIVLVYTSVLIEGCGQPTYYSQPQPVVVQSAPVAVTPAQDYTIITDPNTGVQNAVFYDNGTQMMLELSLFNSMMNMGGYPYVIGHYHTYHYYRYNSSAYGGWRSQPQHYSTYTPSGSGGFRSTGNTPVYRQTRPTAPVLRQTVVPSNTFRPTTTSTPARTFQRASAPSINRGGFRKH